MTSSSLHKEWQQECSNAYLSGGNMAYLDGLYEDYLANPKDVPLEWKAVFDALDNPQHLQSDVSHRAIRDYFLNQANHPRTMVQQSGHTKQHAVWHLIEAYRRKGHLAATLDPLNLAPKQNFADLEPSFYQFSSDDLQQEFEVPKSLSAHNMSVSSLIALLKKIYCGAIGIEYMHIQDSAQVAWIQEKIESMKGQFAWSGEQKKSILEALIAADGFERYLGTKYVGQKRFSLEGGDSLIPMLQEINRQALAFGTKEVMIGMAHRGRLNVLVNILGKAPKQLFEEFEGKINPDRSGDVKYHMGFSSDVVDDDGKIIHLGLAFNPSHLEIVSPVVEGSVRARLAKRDDLAEKQSVVPVVIHGDAAFAGQGVVMETFNFSQSRGYCTGGTVHIVVNNQVGFTTSNPQDARSTAYCTDVAKMIEAPVIHVNGDSPDAVVFAAQMALEFRMKFKRDVVIDLMCYRRHGHNEADEPSVTQPVMYQKIKSMQPLRVDYANQLIAAGILTQENVDSMIEAYRTKLDSGESLVSLIQGNYPGKIQTDWMPYLDTKWTLNVKTSVDAAVLQDLSNKLNALPQGFELHPVVSRLLAERDKMVLGEIPMNWGFAETMAYATLLQEGYGVRLSGQDSGRGTFAHRHAVLHDVHTGETYVPLQKIHSNSKKPFEVIDSVLSEEAVLAFEYGYAASEPATLVLWEAQFGDFVNGAQVVIDQFISSGEQKWGELCGLVMLLPHGYEGQGPEHSSARLERFMQLCAQQNIQVCVPTTPAQMFHLLRRQMLRPYRKPLVVMTPKSLLRHKLAVSSMADLTEGQFHNVIPEVDNLNPQKVTRVVLCSGKVYYDLLQKRRDDGLNHIAIIRIEQLYPFPKKALTRLLAEYSKAKTIIWCQEEPENQGAWFSSQHNMRACLADGQHLRYAGRGFAASPAAGSIYLHTKEQDALIAFALTSED